MSLKKYAAFPTARMQMFYAMSEYQDVAVLDASTEGHALYHYGHLPWIWTASGAVPQNLFYAHFTEVELALGDFSRLYRAVGEIAQKGYQHIFLLPSSLGSVLGFDTDGLTDDLSRRYGCHVFTVSAGLDDDFYQGMRLFTDALVKFAVKKDIRGESDGHTCGISILGGISENDQRAHRYLSNLISGTLGVSTIFDSMSADRMEQWNRVLNGQVNLVTSGYAIPAAEFLKERFDIPYITGNILGYAAEQKLLTELSRLLQQHFEPREDGVYSQLLLQMQNILDATGVDIVCYADADRLRSLKAFFAELGYPAKYICSHRNSEFEHLEADDMIDTYRNQFVISYDRICHFCRHSIAVDELGLDYTLRVPLPDAICGKEGAYRLMRAMADKLL